MRYRWLARIAVVAGLLIHFQAVALLWTLVSAGPTTGADFASYYFAAVQAHEGEDPYDTLALNRLAGRNPAAVRSVNPFFYPPPFLLLVAWAPALDPNAAFRVWFWVNELALLGVMLTLVVWWRDRAGPWLAPVLAWSLAASPPLVNLFLGQANFITMLACFAGLAFAEKRRPLLGGALVGIACMAKMSPALFVFWWVLHRRWTPVASACATAAILTILVLPLVGFEYQLRFYTDVLPGFGTGEYNGLHLAVGMFNNHSVYNFIHEVISPGVNLSDITRWLGSLVTLLMLGGVGWWLRPAGPNSNGAAAIGLISVVGLLIPIYTYEHHLVMALPALALASAAIANRQLGLVWIVPLALAWLAWSVSPGTLREWVSWLDRSGQPSFAFVVKESKFIALLIAAAAAGTLAHAAGDDRENQGRAARTGRDAARANLVDR